MRNTGGALIIALCLITGAIIQRERADAALIDSLKPVVVPYAGRFQPIGLCCNGILFNNTSEFISIAQGPFSFDFENMIPNPILGTGLYANWTLLPGTKILGAAKPGGGCAIIETMCLTTVPMPFAAVSMGTSILP
jgi:hypothetical protein